jgi:hypothetical protein
MASVGPQPGDHWRASRVRSGLGRIPTWRGTTRTPLTASPARVVPAVVTAGMAVLALGSGYEAARGHRLEVEAVVAVACLTAVLIMPARRLALITLLLIFVPLDEAPKLTLIHLPLAALPLLAWVVQARHRPIPSVAILSLGLLCWVALSLAFATLTTRAGVLWTFCFIVSPCVVGISGAQLDDDRARRLFLDVMSVLGVYAAIETFVLHSNPLMDPVWHAAAVPLLQKWGTYRATTILGHPLLNATFFAVAAVLGLDRFLRKDGRRLHGMQTVAVVIGEIATKSRGPEIAMGIGMVALLALRASRGISWRSVAAMIGMVVAFWAGAVVFLARNDTAIGKLSTDNRSGTVANARQAIAGHTLFGVGPGESEAYRQATKLRGVPTSPPQYFHKPPPAPTVIESAYGEMAVSIGIPGALLFVLVLAAAVASSFSDTSTEGVGIALIVFGVCIAGFNALEGHAQLLALLGFLMVWANPRQGYLRFGRPSAPRYAPITSASSTGVSAREPIK